MSDIPGLGDQAESSELAGEAQPAGVPPGHGGEHRRRPRGRRRRGRRIALICTASVVTVVVAVAVGGYATVNHVAGKIDRIPVAELDAANQPVMPTATAKSMTILLTGSNLVPPQRGGNGALHSSTAPEDPSGLISLIHINANLKAGAVVSIPGNAEVAIPGHGKSELENALKLGGPSLLIRTVEQLTDVRIDHYSVVSFSGLISALGPLGGVNVEVPATTSSNGVVFHKGVNHLTTSNVLDYLRQSSLSEEGRVLRQQALLRAIVQKFASEDLLTNPLKDLSLLDAFTGALSVDSNFSNRGLETLAGQLHLLRAGSGTYVTAPVFAAAANSTPVQLNAAISGKLWQAIRHDAVAAFAKQYPATVTPGAPS
jgi:LCP family protein required for cell wall assembly